MHDTFYSCRRTRQRALSPSPIASRTDSLKRNSAQPPTSDFTPTGGGGDWLPLVSTDGGGGLLSSTASDYIRFTRTLLDGGALDGARILSAKSVALMGQNHIGALGVPRRNNGVQPDYHYKHLSLTFIADDGRDKWRLGFLITTDPVPGKRSAGSLSWCGLYNTYFCLDPGRGITGVIMMQQEPFGDSKVLALYDSFERGVYQLANVSR